MKAYVDAAESPAGKILFAVDDENGAFVHLRFEDGGYETRMEDRLELAGYILSEDPEKTKTARNELLEYNEGVRRTFDTPLATGGSTWQSEVWRSLVRIPFGETRTYSEVAAMCGRGASAARAVGSANAANRAPLVVPCHRVVGSDGSLTGFAGGTHMKKKLLAHEAKVAGGFSHGRARR